MNGQPADVPSGGEPASGVEPDDSPALDPAPSAQAAPTLAEDLLLLLFQPGAGGRGSGAIAGEGTLFYVLAGAVVTELALGGHVRPEGDGGSAARVEAVAGRPPADALLHKAWEYIAVKPRGMQTVLAAIGPMLRKPVLDRVVARGDIRRTSRRALGLFETTVLLGDGGERRANLVAAVRSVLADGATPTPRVAALAALLSGSGALPQFYREIPWNSAVATRGKQLEQGDWGASAASEAVVRTLTAIVVSSVVVATQPRT